MKRLLLILLCLPFINFAQQTYVPDDNFNYYLEKNGIATQSLCDSVIISFNQMDTTTTPDLIYFDVQVFGFGPSVGYPGFILLNSLGDTIG